MLPHEAVSEINMLFVFLLGTWEDGDFSYFQVETSYFQFRTGCLPTTEDGIEAVISCKIGSKGF